MNGESRGAKYVSAQMIAHIALHAVLFMFSVLFKHESSPFPISTSQQITVQFQLRFCFIFISHDDIE